MNIDDAEYINSIWTNDDDDNSFTTTLSPSEQQYEEEDGEIIIEVIDHLSDTQVKVLSLLFIFSATLSILGSSTIVLKVVRNRSKSTPYDRIMLGLSGCDVVASLSWILTPFLLPEETSPRVWARGTDTTCTILGTLTQFGYAAIFYNLVLSVYYLLTVRFGIKRQIFAQRYEPWMHIVGLLYFAGTAVTGGILGVYSEVDIGLGCWVNDFPIGCDRTTCISGYIAWAFGAGPLLITLVALIAMHTIIYYHVKTKLGGGQQQQQENSSSIIFKPEGLTSDQARQVPTQQQLDRAQQHQRHIREVATQGSLYVLTFFCAYTPSQILRAIEAYAAFPISEQPIFPLFVFNSILLPLQGFFNMFVYNRPNYTRLRVAYPELSAFWAIRMACWDQDIPRLTEASKISSRSGARLSVATGGGGGNGGLGGGSYHQRRDNKSSSGRAFSSELDVLEEASQEESLSSSSGNQQEKNNNNNLADEDDGIEGRLNAKTSSSDAASNFSNSDFDLSEEYKKLFKHTKGFCHEQARNNNTAASASQPTATITGETPRWSCLRISHDGSVR
jgi:hypothetical protein